MVWIPNKECYFVDPSQSTECGLVVVDKLTVPESFYFLYLSLVFLQGGGVLVGEYCAVRLLEPVLDVGLEEGQNILNARDYSFGAH